MIYSENLTKLAEAFRDGEDCVNAFHDALVESGYPKLAELHLKMKKLCTKIHHDGKRYCWLVDIILSPDKDDDLDALANQEHWREYLDRRSQNE